LFDAASSIEANLAEGWRRYQTREMGLFVRYALGSAEETKTRVIDGVHRGYFAASECEETLTYGKRCGAATMALLKSLQNMDSGRKPPGSKPRRPGS
jgi:four helix bundle protein